MSCGWACKAMHWWLGCGRRERSTGASGELRLGAWGDALVVRVGELRLAASTCKAMHLGTRRYAHRVRLRATSVVRHVVAQAAQAGIA